ncbi:MAG: prepilin-type N-terminal cleavage/methylation domain-containing protein [Opitutaceae bacterium]|jgi:prepilin-type N-terminal cleavage/methylation domain-containing protein|nr:prepilin-type N-terminal cleavage/methylation domain-containing protein [Opitutaceae bacterium]
MHHSALTRSRFAGGFTLVELLVVIAIIGILAGIIIPVAGRVRESARAVACVSVLRQYGVAFNMFAVDNKDCFPTGSSSPAWHQQLNGYMSAIEGKPGRIMSARAGTCPSLAVRFSEYAAYFSGTTNEEDRRGYQYNRYLNRDTTSGDPPVPVPAVPFSAIPAPSRTLMLWESMGVGTDSKNISGYPGGSYYYPKYRHRGKMNCLMVSGAVVTRRGNHDADETKTDTSIDYAAGGINWAKEGEPFFFKP